MTRPSRIVNTCANGLLMLQGALRDERARYGAGEICRSRPGSVHSEEALPGEGCVCYVLYYGENHPLE